MSNHTDSTVLPETHRVFGTVEFILQSGILHQVHAGVCLGCGETEEWVKGDAHSILGTASSNGSQPVVVIA